MRDFARAIERLAREKTCVVGMGNYLRRDDAAGLYVVDGIGDAAGGNLTVMNVEDVIESYVFAIAAGEAENVVIVDAVRTGGAPGSVIFGRLGEFDEAMNDYSTHRCSLFLSGKVLEEHDKKAWLIGIEAADTDFGEGLSDEVRSSAEHIRDMILHYSNRDHKESVYEH